MGPKGSKATKQQKVNQPESDVNRNTHVNTLHVNSSRCTAFNRSSHAYIQTQTV